MHNNFGAKAAIALSLLCGTAATAGAQQVLSAPDAVRSCLCQEQTVSTLASSVLQQNRVYEDRRKALENLDNEVRARRAQINVSNQGEVDAFKQLLDSRDQAAAEFGGPVTRTYSDMVARYNAAVASFNSGCAGKAYDPDVLAQVRSNLVCPRP
jgi:hypothetical protein